MKKFWSSSSAKPLRLTVYAVAVTGFITLVTLAVFGDATAPEVEAMVGSRGANVVLGVMLITVFLLALAPLALPIAGFFAWSRYRSAERNRAKLEQERAKQEELRRLQDKRSWEQAQRKAAENRRRIAERRRRAEAAKRYEEERNKRMKELLQRDKVMDRIHYMSGLEFERFIADLFRKQGYSVKRTPGSGDQGIDLLVDIGGRKIAVQLKRWTAPVGNAAVQATFTGMFIYEAQEAWLITTSSFTRSASDAARKTGVRLMDGNELAHWVRSIKDEQ